MLPKVFELWLRLSLAYVLGQRSRYTEGDVSLIRSSGLGEGEGGKQMGTSVDEKKRLSGLQVEVRTP